MTTSILFDSSAWVELLGKGPLSSTCRKIMSSSELVGVPTIAIFEIYRKVLKVTSEDAALTAVAYLKTFPVLDLSVDVALTAADLSGGIL